jgi:uncharacterized RDD family membrane protein YckC
MSMDRTGRAAAGTRADPFDPDLRPELYDGILSKRIVAFLVDAAIIFALLVLGFILVGILGLITFGLGWLLFAPLFAIVALGYVALTLGGPSSATVGMRLSGIEMRRLPDGAPIFPLLAAVHALIFWFSMSFPPLLLIALVSRRRRLAQDIVLGTVVVNAFALRRAGIGAAA